MNECIKSHAHARHTEDVLQEWSSHRQRGLDAQAVAQRQTKFGANRLPEPPPRPAWRRFLAQFNNLLIHVLLVAAAVTFALGALLDCGVILAVVLINAVIGHIQEGKAEAAVEAIRNMLSLRAMVLRDGLRQEIDASALVPGDIVFLQSGDKVPADLRLIEARNLRIEESALTGESVPVEKQTDPVAPDAAVGDRNCMAHTGTLVTFGQGAGVVVAIGSRTEIGRVQGMLAGVEQLTTPLLRRVAVFGRQLTFAILALAGLTFAAGVWMHGYAPSAMFMSAVGLAVAAIPEGLPAVMTITLALGMHRMAQRHAIVRRLPAIEALGSVTVICSDKTGTLTRNEMTVQGVLLAEETLMVSGAGYAPEGALLREGVPVCANDDALLAEIARGALLCNDAALHHEDGHWRVDGDPMEGALLTLALKAGLDRSLTHKSFPRTDVIPFESEHAFMATLHHDHAGHAFVIVKGAPERVLAMCSHEKHASGEQTLNEPHWHTLAQQAAAQGQRVLAIATRAVDTAQRDLQFDDIRELTMLALLAISDPPREEAIAAVARCRSAGIRVKMITGDHVVTARAIGARVGLGDDVRAVAGAELDGLDDVQLRELVRHVDVFARASPAHKLRLVQALQANGEVVAMTGDGVNDAPALKRADVGVAMGGKGTEAAKEAAEIVLADDNFASIAHAVEEGRAAFDNVRKAILHMLPTNGGEAAMILVPVLLGMGAVAPITPAQILWVNTVCAVAVSLALAFEPPEYDIMQRPPRDPRAGILNALLGWRILLVSSLLLMCSLGLFLWTQAQGASLEYARTAAVTMLVFGEAFYLFNCRFVLASALAARSFSGNDKVPLSLFVLLLLQLAYVYLPAMQNLFGSEGLHGQTWLLILAGGLLIFLVVELEKAWQRRRHTP